MNNQILREKGLEYLGVFQSDPSNSDKVGILEELLLLLEMKDKLYFYWNGSYEEICSLIPSRFQTIRVSINSNLYCQVALSVEPPKTHKERLLICDRRQG